MAVTLTAAELSDGRIGEITPAVRAQELLAVASAHVERYAPSAPPAVQNEAVIRFAGYLYGSDYGGILSETSVGSAVVTYAPNHADAFRRSGAASLLSPYRVRRAGAIG